MMVVELAQKEHQGLTKTERKLNSKVWWAGIYRQVEAICKTCHGYKLAGRLVTQITLTLETEVLG